MKSRIINGAMVIDQRNAGASVSNPTAYTLDRWTTAITQASKITIQQNAGAVTLPIGFNKYLGVTSTSAYSVLTGDTFLVEQLIEGYNTSDLGFGTANASAVTLSFKVYSSLTGTFGGSLSNNDGSRTYPFTYSISTVNTWTSISVTIAGDTSGTWIGATNGIGIRVRFGLGSGATYSGTAGAWASANYVQPTSTVSVVGTSGATFYITGVQLEKGSTATSFDYRPYGTELALCQRYCYVMRPAVIASGLFSGLWYSTTLTLHTFIFPVVMRFAPALTYSALADFVIISTAGGDAPSAIAASAVSTTNCRMDFTSSAARTAGQGCIIQTGSTSSVLTFSSEL
jgi:hypothetical protein